MQDGFIIFLVLGALVATIILGVIALLSGDDE